MKRSTASFALAFLLAGVLAAQTSGRRGGPPPGLLELGKGGVNSACLDALGLSDAEKTAIAQLRSDLAAAAQPLFGERRGFHEQIDAALQAATPDPTAIGRLVIADHGVGERIRTEHERFRTRFEAVLSPDQLTNFKALRENGACAERAKHFH
jgi:Spy/CpxP family protein refolding chaperone